MLGSITTDGSGEGTLEHTDSDGMNLLGGYSTLNVIDGDGMVVVADTLPAGSITHIRHVMSGWGPSPDGLGLGEGALSQGQVALAHTMLSKAAADEGNLDGARQHAEHVVNIIEGSEGANFGDLDGNGAAQNPGDGFGVIVYADGASQHAGCAAGADGATAGISLHGQHVTDSFANTSMWMAGARDQALLVISATEAGMAATYGASMVEYADMAINGTDANGDGSIGPVLGESGAIIGYQHAQFMAKYSLELTGAAAPSLPKSGGAAGASWMALTVLAVGALLVVGGLRLRRKSSAY